GCMAAAMTRQNYRPARELFPVNVIANIFTAVERTEETAAYFQASENFSYGSQSVRNSDAEIYVLVIGETSRADHWQLNGYGRPTNPRLSSRSGIVYYPRTLSESNTTHKSVPLLMTCFASDDFADSIYSSRSVIDAFREAGFRTAWFSNQRRNHSLIDFFGERADSVNFLVDDGLDHYDAELAECLSGFIEHSAEKKLFVVLHTYGSHFNYKERYPGEFEYFGPDNSTNASRENRAELVNAYDNSLRYVDYTLDRIISNLDSCGHKAALLYLADHGEDIYDDSRDRFLHASPTPTYYQLHVPMILWMSDSYVKEYPEIESAAKANSSKNVSSSRSAFHTLLSLAGIRCSRFEAAAALSDTAYREPQRFYLNDYNEAVPLDASGLRDQDFQRLAAEGIR
ncbi:MAG: phosphoethanolamine transferase, partial [Muribaculaceae bacterium]|nr:phosphoethanolamine transferase [Muribaculaceae bacterium]